ncbi:hypothetical protein F5Y12DRAFT_253162 [Xylaria sp. FL1777]|nr:hypothetical protein F5Y12DRAFT_253162 [Xylaria sp. FL1777]
MVQEIYHLNGPQQGPGRHNGPMHRPPQGPPGGFPQGHPQGHPVIPPAPPRNMIPIDLRGGPAVQILDITQDLLSEADKEEELTDYMVFRFEKMPDKDGFDDHGRPKWPSWEKTIRTEDRSISKQVAFNKVRELNLNTRSVLDKKNSLTSPLKRQIDITVEQLMNREPDVANFHWILAQIDHQLRPVEPYYPVSYTPARKHRSSTAYPYLAKRKSHSSSSSHHSKKKKKAYERIALTAYFKRVPRPGVNIDRLWREKRRGLDGMYQANLGAMNNVFPQMHPNQAQFPGPQQQQHHHQQQHQHQQHQGQHQGQPPMRMPNGNAQGPHPGHQNRPMNRDPRQQNGGQGQRGQNMGRRNSDSESDSDEGSSSGGSRRGSQTPPSSVSDHRGRGPHHRPQHKDRHPPPPPPHHHHPHQAGGLPNHLRPHTPRNERPVNLPRPRPNSSPLFPRTSLSPRRSPHGPAPAPAPPYPVSHDGDGGGGGSVASHIERIREDAYRRGRLAERTDARLAEELAFTKAAAQGRPRPRIVQERSPLGGRRGSRLYRTTRGGDVDEGMMPRYFARLSLSDDGEDRDRDRGRYRDRDRDRDVDEYDEEEDEDVRREYERRVQQGSILEEDAWDLYPPSPTTSSSYTYYSAADGGMRGHGLGHGRGRGRRAPQIIEIPERRHPLSSPRLRRRPSYHH